MSARVTIASCMATDLLTFSPGLDISQAVSRLLARRISGAPVIDENGALVGIITAKDCFKAALHASYYQGWGGVVADYMSTPVQTLGSGLDLVSAAGRFLDSDFRRFPVVDGGRLVGVVTRLDLLRALDRQW